MSFSKDQIIEKISTIKFRGPDYTGYKKIDNVSLSHVRLSIIDLDERSHQPMSFCNLHIVFNGEIYNYQEIRNILIDLGHSFVTESDTEVLLHGYKEWGSDLLPKINGMFAFSIYDDDLKVVFSARDRLGVAPFYYYWKDGQFEICSQLRPIITPESKVNDEAISIYLDCGYVPSPHSIIEHVYKLPPGNFMTIDLLKNEKIINEYWNLKPVVRSNLGYEAAKEELHKLLIDSVKIRLKSDVPMGTFLSGGIDSALVSSIAAKISTTPINTFTIGFDDPEYDESKVARQFAEIIGSNHVETICKQDDVLKMLPKLIEVYDEPFADSSALPSLLLNSVTKKYATVALSGDGGDESFMGYVNFDWLRSFNKLSNIPYFFRNLISKPKWNKVLGTRPDTINGFLRAKNSDDFAIKIFIGYESLQIFRQESWLKLYTGFKDWSYNSFQKMADLNIKLWLENDSNVKVDRASKAFEVEVRSPFLDYRIVEFARTLPVNFRYDNGAKKRILKDILNDYIPKEIFDQPKKGFSIPLGKWIREDLQDEINNELTSDFLNRIPNLDVPKFKLQLQQHMTGKYDYSFNIWKLFVLAKWYKEFKF